MSGEETAFNGMGESWGDILKRSYWKYSSNVRPLLAQHKSLLQERELPWQDFQFEIRGKLAPALKTNLCPNKAECCLCVNPAHLQLCFSLRYCHKGALTSRNRILPKSRPENSTGVGPARLVSCRYSVRLTDSQRVGPRISAF